MIGAVPQTRAAAGVSTGLRAGLVFAVSFALLLSDYMSRQVLAAVFPLLKADWGLSDGQLGSLGGVVALMVGLLTFPLSLAADRLGRVRSVVAMAVVWSLATLACGLAANYQQMLLARLFLGVGEAAYGSVGLAVVFSFFPPQQRATITGAFMAGGVFGSFLGMALGGILAAQFGWRWSFAVLAVAGLALAGLYALIVRREPATGELAGPARLNLRAVAAAVFGSRTAVLAYVASGLQLFAMGALVAWLTSYFNRAYGLEPARAAVTGAGFLLIGGVGMIVCGALADRAGRNVRGARPVLAGTYCLIASVALGLAFLPPAGAAGLVFLGLGLFFTAGASGPAGAMVADSAPPQFHGAALATLTLANNLIGLAPGAAITGLLADRYGLQTALAVAAGAGLPAAALFWCSALARARNPQLQNNGPRPD